MIRSAFLWFPLLTLSLVALPSAHTSSLVTPQSEHELLKRFAGEWQFERLSPARDAAEPDVVGQGTVSAEMVGEFFVDLRWSGEVYDSEYSAVMSLGYDIEREAYTGSWVDSIISYRWELAGGVDESSDELVLSTSGPGPAGGEASFRERYQFHSADAITIVGEMLHDGEWVNIVNTKLTRQED
jgi:hypothetical protein